MKDQPFAVYQKFVLASVSYPARALGLRKLESLVDVKERLPDLRMVNGENLAPYRKAGIELLQWLRSKVPGPIERLGLEELRFEITEAVNEAERELSGFDLSMLGGDLPDEMADGIELPFFRQRIMIPDFYFGLEDIKLLDKGADKAKIELDLRSYIAGHFANYIRLAMRSETNYRCSIGVGSSKTLAKLAGAQNKPFSTTLLLPGAELLFLESLPIKKITGLGSRTFEALVSKFSLKPSSTVKDLHALEKNEVLKVLNEKIWDLTWGKEDLDLTNWELPKQVSVEDTWKIPLTMLELERVQLETERLVDELLSQAHTDLISEGRWLVIPHTFKVSIMFHNGPYKRHSRSMPLRVKPEHPDFVKTLLQMAKVMLRDLCKEPFRLINVCLMLRPVED